MRTAGAMALSPPRRSPITNARRWRAQAVAGQRPQHQLLLQPTPRRSAPHRRYPPAVRQRACRPPARRQQRCAQLLRHRLAQRLLTALVQLAHAADMPRQLAAADEIRQRRLRRVMPSRARCQLARRKRRSGFLAPPNTPGARPGTSPWIRSPDKSPARCRPSPARRPPAGWRSGTRCRNRLR